MFAGDWKLSNPLNAPAQGRQATVPKERLRWSVWARGMTGEALVRWVRDEVFPFYAEIAEQRRHQLHGRRPARRSTSRRC